MPAALMLAALLQIQNSSGYRPLTDDDCKIIVLAGREILGWGNDAPKYVLQSGHNNVDGSPAYRMDCDWKRLGIVPPQLSTRNGPTPPGVMRNWNSDITRPVYDTSGLIASVGVALSNTRPSPMSLATWSCSFYKYGAQWNLASCKALTCITEDNGTKALCARPTPAPVTADPKSQQTTQ